MPVDYPRKFIFIHIPKCGGTSIAKSIGWLEEYPNIGKEPTHTKPDFDKVYGHNLQHMTAKELVEFEYIDNIKNYYSFTFIRDPFERLVSHFFWHKYSFQDLSQIPFEQLKDEFTQFVKDLYSNYKDNEIFKNPYKGYVHNIIDQKEGFNLQHILPQVSYIYSAGKPIVEEIFLFENFTNEFEKVRSKYPDIGELEKKMKTKSSITDYSKLYSWRTKRLVSKLYNQDIKFFNDLKSGKYDRSQKPLNKSKANKHIPRKLWMAWFQGIEDAPSYAKISVESWKKLNPDWDITVVTYDNLQEHLNFPEIIVGNLDKINPTALSDLVRLNLLKRNGGVWTDASTIPLVPLDEWIDKATKDSKFFGFSRKEMEDRPIISWFLSSTHDSYIAKAWSEKAETLWIKWLTEDKDFGDIAFGKDEYFWVQNIFGELLSEDKKFRKLWESRVDVHHQLSHQMSNRFFEPLSDEMKYIMKNRRTNVIKLNHRGPYKDQQFPIQIDNTNLGYYLDMVGIKDFKILDR